MWCVGLGELPWPRSPHLLPGAEVLNSLAPLSWLAAPQILLMHIKISIIKLGI